VKTEMPCGFFFKGQEEIRGYICSVKLTISLAGGDYVTSFTSMLDDGCDAFDLEPAESDSIAGGGISN
jgi:hypothetical protein